MILTRSSVPNVATFATVPDVATRKAWHRQGGYFITSLTDTECVPYSNLTLIARKTGVASVAQALANDPDATGILPGKGQQVEPPSKPAKKISDAVSTEVKRKTKQHKPLPIVKWTRLRTSLTIEGAQTRMQIREFVLRFAPIMSNTISKTHLEELANIGGPAKSDLDEEEIVPWVSENCTKSVIMGLLGLLDDGEDKEMGRVGISVDS